MNKIKVLHVVECAGGVDRYLRMLLTYMERRRFEQTVVCSHDFSRDAYLPFVDRFEYVDMCNSLSPGKDAKAVMAVRSIIKRCSTDIVYCHSSKGGGIGRLACIGLRMPILYNPHGWAFSMRGSKVKSFVYLCIERVLSLFTSHFVMISNYEKLRHDTVENGLLRVRALFDVRCVACKHERLIIKLGVKPDLYIYYIAAGYRERRVAA